MRVCVYGWMFLCAYVKVCDSTFAIRNVCSDAFLMGCIDSTHEWPRFVLV